MHKVIFQIVKILCNLKDIVIEQSNKNIKKRENMENNTQEKFLNYMKK